MNSHVTTEIGVSEGDTVPQFLFVLNIGTTGIILVFVIRTVKHKDEIE